MIDPSTLSAQKRALLDRWRRTAQAATRAPDGPLPRTATEARLSFAQRRIWILEQLEPGTATYNVPSAIHIEGALDVARFERALLALVARHAALRTTFEAVDGEPRQRIHERIGLALPLVDLRALPATTAEARVAEAARAPFDLANGPLLRAQLLRLGAERHLFVLVAHHLVTDGWSMGIMVRELTALYLADGDARTLPPLTIDYADFAEWQRDRLAGERLASLTRYWREQLGDAPAALDLPADRRRPAVQSRQGGAHRLTLPTTLAAQLNALARAENVTLYILTCALFKALLHRYTGEADLCVGTPVANRTRAELEPLVGCFVNTLVLRSRIDGQMTLRQVIQAVRRTAIDAYQHQDLPFELLVDEVLPERDLSHSPLFQVMFVLQNSPMPAVALDGLRVRSEPVDNGTAKFDLWVGLTETSDGLDIAVEYSADLFEADTIARLMGHYAALLAQAADALERPIAALPLLSTGEEAELRRWNATETSFAGEPLVHRRIAAQAARTPDAIALVFEDSELTYAELWRRVTLLAARLRREGVGPEVVVGVCLERSAELVIALLAVLEAGGAYLPLDPQYPLARLRFMLDDARAPLLVTMSPLLEQLGPVGARAVCLDRLDDAPALAPSDARAADQPAQLAYVIYTSGSTGTPKAAMNQHRAVCNRLDWMQAAYRLDARDRVLQKTPFSFDVSVWELWWPLMVGARLVVAAPGGHQNPAYLRQLIRAAGVTTLHFVPSMLKVFLDEPELARDCASLKRVVCSGEALPYDVMERCLERLPAQLYNLYGPTEAAVDVTAWPCARNAQKVVPIGRPIANCSIHILDRALRPVPVGVRGELYIGGVAVGRGYLGRPALTAERFVPDPFSRGGRLYRTGDLARRTSDGTIEYLGRVDDQVKLRGLRIELGEIEARLKEQPGVRDAVVVVQKDGEAEPKLVAYVAPHREGRTAPEHELVAEWQSVFDETYREQPADPTLNLSGWRSSYTQAPLGEAVMREWIDETVTRILQQRPRHVLEIGCGTGLLLSRIAPRCRSYVATDASAEAVRFLEQHRAALVGPATVELLHRRADELDDFAPGRFDTVVINSVAQYFPDLDYLARVLERAARLLRPGGVIFVGDVRSLPLLRAFHAMVQLGFAADELSVEHLRQRILRAEALERELVIAPAFFAQLWEEELRAGSVTVQLKRGRHRNELTQFRYDVVLRLGAPAAARPLETLRWSELGDLGRLALTVADGAPRLVTGIPNARLLPCVVALDVIERRRPAGCVADVRRALDGAGSGVEPADVYDLAERARVPVTLTWSATSRDAFDAWFATPQRATGERHHGALANTPLRATVEQRLVPGLKQALREQLPLFMVPASFVVVDAIPVTPNGKLDRAALPPAVLGDESAGFVPPESEVERQLAAIWASVLRLERVGVESNFFELGGDSINAVQVCSRARQLGLALTPRLLFQHQTIAALAAVDELLAAPLAPAATTAPLAAGEDQSYPVTALQAHLLACLRRAPASPRHRFVVQRVVPLPYRLDDERVRRAWQRVAEDHPVLRVSLRDGDEPRQVVHASVRVSVQRHDWSSAGAGEVEARLDAFLAGDRRAGFDPALPEPLRLAIFDLPAGASLVVATFHYMRLDAWSYSLVLRDFFARYEGLAPPSPPCVDYRRYFTWLEARGQSAAHDYYRHVLAGATRTPLVEHDHGDDVEGFARRHVYLSLQTSEALRRLARQARATASAIAQAAWALVLHGTSAASDVLFGVMVAGRPAAVDGIETIEGVFTNILPRRIRLTPATPLREWLGALSAEQLDASEHEHASLDELAALVEGDAPLFDSYLVVQNTPKFERRSPDDEAELLHLFFAQMEHPLRVDVFPERRFLLVLSFYERFFTATTIEALLARLHATVEAMAARPDATIEQLMREVSP